MRPVNIRQSEMKYVTIPIGFEGENEFTQVRINCEDIFAEHPNAFPSMIVTDPLGNKYPAVVTRDSNEVVWNVADSDLTAKGNGEIQIEFIINGNIIGRTDVAKTEIKRSIFINGDAPEGITHWETNANATLAEVNQALHDIPDSIDTALAIAKESGEFDGAIGPQGIPGEKGDKGDTGSQGPRGEKGDKGDTGLQGPQGIQGPKGDKGDTGATGPQGPQGIQGPKGDKGDTGIQGPKGDTGDTGDTGPSGQNGSDGFSPTISVTDITGGHRVTITDATGPHSFDVMNGSDAIAPVQDVQVNGSSILNQGVANVPYASGSAVGVVKVNGDFGTSMRSSPNDNTIMLQRAAADDIQAGVQRYKPITPSMVDVATFFGLSRVAGVDLKNETVTLGQYPDPAKIAIQKMLGINRQWELIRHIETSEDLSDIRIEVDNYGDSFELAKMIVIIQCGPPTTGNRDSFYCQIFGKAFDDNITTRAISSPSLTYSTATSVMCSKTIAEVNKDAPVTISTVTSTSEGNTQNLISMPKIQIFRVITGFRVYQSASDKSLIPSGAIIDMYGIRA